MKKILLLVLMILFLPSNVKADCDNDEIIRLQKIANNINTNYEFNEITNKFKITFSNITDEVIIVDINNKKDYYSYGELEINNLDSGIYTYYIYARDKNCYENELTIKNINLPYYNQYYNSDDCKYIQDYQYCSKWLTKSISYDTWKNNVTKYKESIKAEEKKQDYQSKKTTIDKIKDIFTELYITHYYIFLPIIILSLCAIIYLKNKSDQLI